MGKTFGIFNILLKKIWQHARVCGGSSITKADPILGGQEHSKVLSLKGEVRKAKLNSLFVVEECTN